MAVVLVLATVLLCAAALKAADRTGSVTALGTYGLGGGAAVAGWALVVGGEFAIGIGLLAGVAAAAWAGAGMLAAFAAAQAVVLARGGGGAPCGCFGARGGLSAGSVARAAVLAAGCAATALLDPGAVPAAGSAAVAAVVAVVWLGERAGWLAPRGALSVAGEGPDVGERVPGLDSGVTLFTAPGCRLCARVLRGAEDVATAGEGDPLWTTARVPGAPFAVVARGGVVLARGTVNTPTQLRSLIAEGARTELEAQLNNRGRSPSIHPTRRTLLAQAAGIAAAAVGAQALIRPGEAEAYHFCGHIYTTDSCPHPTGLPRIDARGYPLRARDGKRVDDLGRVVDAQGRPLDDRGALLVDAEGQPLPPATRTRVCTATGRRYGFRPFVDGAWYRCCDGRVRKLVDCCTTGSRRINGDRALTGYCYRRRKVFCVMYYDTRVKC